MCVCGGGGVAHVRYAPNGPRMKHLKGLVRRICLLGSSPDNLRKQFGKTILDKFGRKKRGSVEDWHPC